MGLEVLCVVTFHRVGTIPQAIATPSRQSHLQKGLCDCVCGESVL